jgi:hypothetical protein
LAISEAPRCHPGVDDRSGPRQSPANFRIRWRRHLPLVERQIRVAAATSVSRHRSLCRVEQDAVFGEPVLDRFVAASSFLIQQSAPRHEQVAPVVRSPPSIDPGRVKRSRMRIPTRQPMCKRHPFATRGKPWNPHKSLAASTPKREPALCELRISARAGSVRRWRRCGADSPRPGLDGACWAALSRTNQGRGPRFWGGRETCTRR